MMKLCSCNFSQFCQGVWRFELPINLFLILITILVQTLPFPNYCNVCFTCSTVHLDLAYFQYSAWSWQFEPYVSTSCSVPAHDFLLLTEIEM